MIELPIIFLLLGTILMLTRNIYSCCDVYYGLRESHYANMEAMERYSVSLMGCSKFEVLSNGRSLRIYGPLPAYMDSLSARQNALVPYLTYSGIPPYYVGRSGDRQYIVDKMNFSRHNYTYSWRFKKINPRLGEITSVDNEHKGMGMRRKVYARSQMKEEVYEDQIPAGD